MLDDRCVTPSTAQFDGVGVWDRVSNVTGWGSLLGARRAFAKPFALEELAAAVERELAIA